MTETTAKNQPVACITGATSGIGLSYAKEYAAKGFNLILTGRRKELLEQRAEELHTAYDIKINTIIGDFTDPDVIQKIGKKLSTTPNLEVLVNNAGFGGQDAFYTGSWKPQKDMVDVHINATVELTHQALTIMKSNRKGAIIFVSSLAGFLPSPTSELYSSTKAFLNAFAESLFIAVRPLNIKVQSLCPGFTHTDFHMKLQWDRMKMRNRGLVRWMRADKVVGLSLKALKKNRKPIFIPGLSNRVLIFLISLIPKRLYYRLAEKRRNPYVKESV